MLEGQIFESAQNIRQELARVVKTLYIRRKPTS